MSDNADRRASTRADRRVLLPRPGGRREDDPKIAAQKLGLAVNQRVRFEAWPKPVIAVLTTLNVQTWGDLAALSDVELISFNGIGLHYLTFLRRKLAARGLAFATRASKHFMQGRQLPAAVPTCGVYFLRCGAFLKIGHACDVRRRCIGIALATPFDVELVGLLPFTSPVDARRAERGLHLRFAANLHRLEWFRFEEPLSTYIGTLDTGGTR